MLTVWRLSAIWSTGNYTGSSDNCWGGSFSYWNHCYHCHLASVQVSLVHIHATASKLSMFHTNSPPWSPASLSHLSINPQKALPARCNQVPPPTLHSSILHADHFWEWHWPNEGVWSLCAGVGLDTLLHVGGCDVDRSRSFAHVPKAGHCVCPHHYQIYYCCFTCLLV